MIYMHVLLVMMGKINLKSLEDSNDNNSAQKNTNTNEIVKPPKNKQEE